ncbi:MAG: maltose alpha-D-glucosyltransferase [Betaproteobacteria bacterium]|nr:maltose alpha-D-glucosyltransferase [Betaproteobacteria bacterium]
MNAPDTDVDAAPLQGEAPPDDALWYKDAVVYQLHIKAFFDSNDDGVGDFRGLAAKLDYVQALGVNTIWLLPFYPSPMRDDGYDVADYHNVHPQYGTRQDFRNFVKEAHRRGLRVITELVVNHTSDQHPWFQAARRAPAGSPKRDYYVWSDADTRYAGTRIIFTDTEKSNWTWDPEAKAYFWHRFFSHQPDLNFDNPKVLRAVFRTMRFWLDMGVDGFRLDAIPYLIEREGTSNENLPETHRVIKEIRTLLDAHYRGRVLLAEANMWPEDVREYFGNADECHMAYHFPMMPRMYMAMAQEDRHPLVEIMQQTPEIPDSCQWAIFLRNHDELTLEMVTDSERDYMYRMYAADPRARINLGIRRRLAPLMENDMDRIKLMNSLLLSMPGSPIIYYGDEIGMGDNFYLGDRNGVRTPMQWSPDRNAGFSRADPQRLFLPPIMDPVYGYEAVNVEAQSREPNSLLNWMRRVLAARRSSHAFGRGRLEFLRPGNRKVLAYVREHEGEAILCVANLGRSAQPVELDLRRWKGRVPVEMFGHAAFPPVGDLPYLLTLPGSGFYWFRLSADAEVPHWHEERATREDLPVLILFDGWTSFFRDRVVPWRIAMATKTRQQLEEEVLPGFVELQRWYGAKGDPVKRARLVDHVMWGRGKRQWMVAVFDVESGTGSVASAPYFMPLSLDWEGDGEPRSRERTPATIAKARQQASVGMLTDAMADETFCRALVEAIGAGGEFATAQGKLRFVPTGSFAGLAGDAPGALQVSPPLAQSSNTAVTLGDRLFLKAYRRLRHGVNPEFEVGRFLTDVARFPHCVPVAGAVEHVTADGATTALVLLQAYVSNQGNGWDYTLEYLDRHFADANPPGEDAHGPYLSLARTLGERVAGLHRALATPGGGPDFDPEPVTERDVAAWKDRARAEALATLEHLERGAGRLDDQMRQETGMLLADRRGLLAAIEGADIAFAGTSKLRYHGDLHLGQVLLRNNDFLIIDFEGEPARTLEERRAKHSPLRDVAGMLRSFDYARWGALRRSPRDAHEYARCALRAEAWHAAARQAFLDGYARGAEGAGILAAPETSRGLVRFFEIEKALYELRYELDNRPAWVGIPLGGLRRLVA